MTDREKAPKNEKNLANHEKKFNFAANSGNTHASKNGIAATPHKVTQHYGCHPNGIYISCRFPSIPDCNKQFH